MGGLTFFLFLVEAVTGLRDAVEASVLPLSTPGQSSGLTVRKELLDQLGRRWL